MMKLTENDKKELYQAYDGKRVRITDRTFEPSPYTAHVGAIHFEAHEIESVGE
jgi:hypothetical protein